MKAPICGYFGLAGPDDPPGVVASDGHEADVRGGVILSFFIPLPGGVGGARVLVCGFHGAVLSEMYGQGKMTSEEKGQLVRRVWTEWAREQETPKASWLVPWEGLPEPDREADRRIGETLYKAGQACR